MSNPIYESIKAEHTNVTYLSQPDISLIISKGLTETIREKPRNPIEHFGQWLLSYSKMQKKAREVAANEAVIDDLRDLAREQESREAEKVTEKAKVVADEQAKTEKFWADLAASTDPTDNLGALAQFCQDKIGSTGVYIGELDHPFVEIESDDDEDAHIDKKAARIIKFKWASENHKDLVVGETLYPTEGVTHDVFKTEIEEANSDLVEAAERGSLLTDFQHLYVKEVIREPRMHYWKVPRLGAYMAIPMCVKSTLSVTTL